jgi:L,D-transpeptidase YcbB
MDRRSNVFLNRRGFIRNSAAFAVAMGQAASASAEPNVIYGIRRYAAFNPEMAAFYATRQYRPLWFRGTVLGPEAEILLGLISTAEADGRSSESFLGLGVREAISAARSGFPEALARAEVVLSSAFALYARDLRRAADTGVIYGEPSLQGRIPNTLTVLQRASDAPSFERYLITMAWMHPFYAQLREAIARAPWDGGIMFGSEERRVRLNLERARILPAHEDRYVLVDAAAARLYYYEGGQVRDTMRVVVGTPDEETPMMVSTLRWATLNPYWHVPPDLTRSRIAPRVLSEGKSYFNGRGYEVVSEWSRSARIIDPTTVDWKSVADGKIEILVRQRPGPLNGMGKVKFQFPNEHGIYLHDTSAKQLFSEDQRGLSAGCVRLEDAERFGTLMFGQKLRTPSNEPEQTVTMSKPVPIYITYLTSVVEEGRLVHRKDIYGRDKAQSAELVGGSRAASFR